MGSGSTPASASDFVANDLTLDSQNFLRIDNNIYQLVRDAKSFQDAMTVAAASKFGSVQGHLLAIASEQENSSIARWLSGNAVPTKFFWMAVSDRDVEGVWKFVDGPDVGKAPIFTNWASGEPNDWAPAGGEDYAALNIDSTWNDLSGLAQASTYFIIEYENAAAYDLPSGTLLFQPNETVKYIDIKISGDSINEPDEAFKVNLAYTSGSSTSADFVIRNDDQDSNIIEGTVYADSLKGTNRSEVIRSLDGDDDITGNGGNDAIDGGFGFDTAIYWGESKNSNLKVSLGYIVVEDKTGSDGIDILSNVERLTFSDKNIDATVLMKVASLAKGQLDALVEIYIASFNRAPDALGLDYWGGRYKDGMSLEAIAKSFFIQPETAAKYPVSTTDNSFVTTVYGNVLGRAPDPDGLKYWAGELSNGHITRDVFLLAILNGAHANPSATSDIANLNNKVAVAEHFALAQGLNNGTWSQNVMAGVTSASSTVTAANAMTDNYATIAAAPATSELVVKILGIVA